MFVIILTTLTRVYFILLIFLLSSKAFYINICSVKLSCFSYLSHMGISVRASLRTYCLSYHEEKFHFPFQCAWAASRLFCFSVTTSGSEGTETRKATEVPGSLCKTPEDIRTPPEDARTLPEDVRTPPEDTRTPPEDAKSCLQTPMTSECGSPIVQEPEEAPEPKEERSPRKTSLVIVESADDQPQVLERLDGDVAFQKVRLPFLHVSFLTCAKAINFLFLFILL